MKRRLAYSMLVTALGVNLFFGAQVYLRSDEASARNDVYGNLRLFATVLERVWQDYVDGDELTYQDLIYGALRGMLSTLDPHSEFMEPRKYEDLKSDTEGIFGGIGIQVGIRSGALTVIAPMEDTPAFRSGILSGDRIIKIEGKTTENMSLTDAVAVLRGKPGTEVTITILRPSSGATEDHTLTRGNIEVDTIKDIEGRTDFRLGEDGIGYIRINQFGNETSEELDEAIGKLDRAGMRGLILDLRDNPGGLLDQAAAVCGRFLPPRTMVVSTEGRDPRQKREFRAPRSGEHIDHPMVVLVNGGSASASEIVAGCLQDLDRAVILGEKTFGKGSVQSIIPLPDGAALRLTTAKYYTPSHKVIHEKGITPDIIVETTPEEAGMLAMKRVPGAVETLDPTQRAEFDKVKDLQLERARDLLHGIVLFTDRQSTEESVLEVAPAG